MRKYENFYRALTNLKEGASAQKPYTILEQTGLTALFTNCFAACTNQTTENVQTNITTAVSSETVLTEETTTVMNVEIACTLYEPEDSEK